MKGISAALIFMAAASVQFARADATPPQVARALYGFIHGVTESIAPNRELKCFEGFGQPTGKPILEVSAIRKGSDGFSASVIGVLNGTPLSEVLGYSDEGAWHSLDLGVGDAEALTNLRISNGILGDHEGGPACGLAFAFSLDPGRLGFQTATCCLMSGAK